MLRFRGRLKDRIRRRGEMVSGGEVEYVALLHAAKALGKPVKWADQRSESFVSDHHGRDHEFLGELALDDKGKFLAVRFTGYGNMGAHLGTVSPLAVPVLLEIGRESVYGEGHDALLAEAADQLIEEAMRLV